MSGAEVIKLMRAEIARAGSVKVLARRVESRPSLPRRPLAWPAGARPEDPAGTGARAGQDGDVSAQEEAVARPPGERAASGIGRTAAAPSRPATRPGDRHRGRCAGGRETGDGAHAHRDGRSVRPVGSLPVAARGRSRRPAGSGDEPSAGGRLRVLPGPDPAPDRRRPADPVRAAEWLRGRATWHRERADEMERIAGELEAERDPDPA